MSVTSVKSIGSVQADLKSDKIKKLDEGGELFKDVLDKVGGEVAKKEPLPLTLKFSNHAVERMSQRGIFYTPEQIRAMEAAVTKASGKGAQETLVFSEQGAAIVDVKNKTIVTVMDKGSMKENVFTNIDSTIFI